MFIGEGTGGAFLREYEKVHAEELAEEGLLASFYSDKTDDSLFVTDELVREIKNAVARDRYRRQWGRDMPEAERKPEGKDGK